MKIRYDKDAKSQSSRPGDIALILLPVLGSPGSPAYKVLEKVGNRDYIVAILD